MDLKTSSYVAVFRTFDTAVFSYTGATQNSHYHLKVPTTYCYLSNFSPATQLLRVLCDRYGHFRCSGVKNNLKNSRPPYPNLTTYIPFNTPATATRVPLPLFKTLDISIAKQGKDPSSIHFLYPFDPPSPLSATLPS